MPSNALVIVSIMILLYCVKVNMGGASLVDPVKFDQVVRFRRSQIGYVSIFPLTHLRLALKVICLAAGKYWSGGYASCISMCRFVVTARSK